MSSSEVYFLNVPERGKRGWDEFRRLGYISSVGCARTLDALSELTAGDRIAAYLRRCGYVGIGLVLGSPSPAQYGEYLLPVRWLRAVDRRDGRWLPRRGLYASPQVMAPMAHRMETLRFLQEAFDVSLTDAAGQLAGGSATGSRWPVSRSAAYRPDQPARRAATAVPR